MKKKLTLLLTLAMLLGLAACGNKTDTSTGTGANPSKENSEAVEKETGAVESVVGEVVDAIEEAVRPQPGDVTDKMYFADGIGFTSATPLEFKEWNERGSSTDIHYELVDGDLHAWIQFWSGDGSPLNIGIRKVEINTPEGAYDGYVNEYGMTLFFGINGKDGRAYEIAVEANEPSEEYVSLFLQLVEEFLDSGIPAESKMSDIQYDLNVPAGDNIFTSPDAIEAE